MNNSEYRRRHIELTDRLNFAAWRRPCDPDFYNDTIEEIEGLEREYCFGRQVHCVLRIIFAFIALLGIMFIIYSVVTELRFAPEGWGF